MKMVTETGKAYAAGLIDGEGSIYIACGRMPRSNEPKYQAFITVTTCDKVLPGWMHEHFGGSCNKKVATAIRRGAISWQLSGRRNIIWFLELIRPYLTLKQEQADLMIEFCELRQAAMERPVGERGYGQREIEIINQLRGLHGSRLTTGKTKALVDGTARPERYWGLELGVEVSGWDDCARIEEMCDRAVGHAHHSAEMQPYEDAPGAVRNLAYEFSSKRELREAVRRVQAEGLKVIHAQADLYDRVPEEDSEAVLQ